MAVVGNYLKQGRSILLDSVNDWTHWAEPAGGAGLVDITLEFSADWNGTVTFERGVKVDGSYVSDPVTATNLNGAGTATTSTGGADADENWRVDSSGGATRVEITTFVAGSVEVTFHVSEG